MDNIFKPIGSLKSQKPDSGGAVLRQVPMLGIVKDNVDPTRTGRIRVYISALGAKDPDDEKNWTPLLYMSSFFGVTDSTGGNNDYGSFKSNPASYGVWTSPPDIGTTVICLFVNGDPNFGFYIGSLPESEALRMVPAIGANFSGQKEKVIFNDSEAEKYGGATRVPVTNMNTNNSSQANSSTFLTTPKPVHSFQASIMFQQGVLRDPIRGPISSSAQRESPSRVGWGVSTPGRPIYQGGYTDETIANAVNEGKSKTGLKVISRRGGHSIVMDDGDLIGQDNLIRIRTSLGHQILMSDDGQTLMLLHSNGQSYIELGKEGTIDMYSTNSVNIRTQGDLNLHADNDININAMKKLNIHADEINIDSETTIKQKSGSNYNVYTQGDYTQKIDGAMSMSSTGDASYASKGTTYINGSVINLNTGSSSTTPEEVESIPIIAQTDTLFSSSKGWAAAPGKLLTIVSRAPAHAPWANAGQGVDVQTDLNADSAFPDSPGAEIESSNEVASTTNDYAPVTVAGVSTVPPVTAASESLDKNTTSSLVSATATQAATGQAASAIQAGAGAVTDATGNITGVAVGVTGLNAKALENANVIKPGSSVLINSLAKEGKTIEQAMPGSLFTGQQGVTNINKFINNPGAQVSATVTNLQQAQTALTKTGLITGKEGPAGIAGPVLSASTNGINSTVDAIKNIGVGVSRLQNSISGTANSVMSSIASGNFAANLSQSVTSGLSGISNAVESMTKGLSGVLDKAKGVAASAFTSITNSFKSFKPNIPQDLGEIGSIKVGSPTEIASGISNIPGGDKTVSSVVNNIPGVTNTIPGTTEIKSLINNAVTASTNNLSLSSAITSTAGLRNSTGLPLPNVTAASSIINSTLAKSLDSLKSGATSLTSLASSGLPAGASSELNSAIASLSSGGSVQIKIPTVALNTVNRGSLTNAINSVLPSGVPAPNFTGVSTESKSVEQSIQQQISENTKKLEELNKQLVEQQEIVDRAESVFFNAKADYQSGDPVIQTAKDKWNAEIKKQAEIRKQIGLLTGVTFSLSGSNET